MKLNKKLCALRRKLSQQGWLDDSFKSWQSVLVLSI